MSKKACRCKHVECEECPEWIFTFADLVMLMMGFFVILWVLKPSPTPTKPDEAKSNEDWIKVAAAVRDAFGYVPDPKSKDPVDMEMILKHIKVPDGEGQGGRTTIRPDGAQGTDPEVTSIRTGKQSVVGGRLLFDRGSDVMPASMARMLDQIVLQVRGHRNIVMIKGHTSLDDLPDKASAEQKMALSLKRAQAVSDYLTSHGVEPEILRVQGASTFEPVIQREYTPDSLALNRRVEVEATATLVRELQQQPKAGEKIESPGLEPSMNSKSPAPGEHGEH